MPHIFFTLLLVALSSVFVSAQQMEQISGESLLDRPAAIRGSPLTCSERLDLNAERQRCWDAYHQWWNGHEHRWETEQNWDRNHH